MKLINTSLTYETKNFKIDVDSNGTRKLWIRPKNRGYLTIYNSESLFIEEKEINEIIEALQEAKEHFKHV